VFGTRVRPGEPGFLSRIGSLVETATAYPNLTVRENLELHRRLTGSPRIAVDEAVALLRLDAYADRRAGQLSLGNKQRLALARALLHQPELLVLDEPANALDPAGIVEVRGLLRRLADERGVTILLSSHILAEVAHLADRIGILHAGRLVEELGVDELRAEAGDFLEIVVSEPERAIRVLSERLGLDRVERTAAGVLRVFAGSDRAPEIARALVAERLDLSRLSPAQEDLEDHFMKLTGGPP